MNKFKAIILMSGALMISSVASAQSPLLKSYLNRTASTDKTTADKPQVSVSDSLLAAYAMQGYDDPFDMPMSLPDVFFMPPVYDTYHFYTPLSVGENVHSGKDYMRWLEDLDVLERQMVDMRQTLYFQHPEMVKYNLAMLPEAPKQYQAVIDPSDFSISIQETVNGPANSLTIQADEIKKRHWIHAFNASLQFSQAYVSPNWYQGGNNNLNALANIYYNVKLNQEFHPNLLFETTAQYKLGINNAPDDKVHDYNISEDVFQVNTTFGVKAAHRWYYSFTGQFKTQMVNSYKSNSYELKSAFLSPGELTAGVGMTYNYTSKRKLFTFDASIAPVSYHLVTCTNDAIDASAYGIDEGKTSKSSFGSTAELKLSWKISYNIRFASRVFAFTDYDSFQADWENTLSCDINKFFTTQIYVHARYDTRTPRDPENNWHKLQVKEIFSIGFAYKFSTL